MVNAGPCGLRVVLSAAALRCAANGTVPAGIIIIHSIKCTSKVGGTVFTSNALLVGPPSVGMLRGSAAKPASVVKHLSVEDFRNSAPTQVTQSGKNAEGYIS